MRNGAKLLTAFMSLALILAAGPAQASGQEKHGMANAAYMEMLHLHSLMDHGLEMVAEGSNIVMFSEQDIAPSLDEMTMEHGRKMILEGKAVIEKTLKMAAAQKKVYRNRLFIRYIGDLGNAEIAFANMSVKLGKIGMAGPADTKARHIRVMIDHTLVMAAQGADLVITGHMGMPTEDAYSVEHGKMMLFDSRTMLSMVKGKEAVDLRDKSSAMEQTLAACNAARRIIDLLGMMPGNEAAVR